ncbi:MAG: hypothetical protein NT154_37865, partial [Verrucomicrobia bacterium]|nr:hypothetical protein [Verrucomicrobiota bacterium]
PDATPALPGAGRGCAFAAGAQRRVITEDAFAAHQAGIEAKRATNVLTASVEFAAREARVVRLVIRRPQGGQPCIDELEVYGPNSQTNLALASRGAVARASSLLPGYAIHTVANLNDGLYGNDHSWIAAGAGDEWAEIELPAAAQILRVVFSRDRNGHFADRQILEAEVRLSSEGLTWQSAGTIKREASELRPPLPTLTFPLAELPEPSCAGAVNYAFLRERDTWSRMDTKDYLGGTAPAGTGFGGGSFGQALPGGPAGQAPALLP